MRSYFILALMFSNISAFADELVIATCVPFDFSYRAKEQLTQVIKVEDQYKLQKLNYTYEKPLSTDGDSVDAKLSSEDNGFTLKLSTFRYELIAKDISKTTELKSYEQEYLFGRHTLHPDSLAYARLSDKVGHGFVGKKVFLATIRYVDARKTSNGEFACYAPGFSMLVKDSKVK